jgi:hypothetical protein
MGVADHGMWRGSSAATARRYVHRAGIALATPVTMRLAVLAVLAMLTGCDEPPIEASAAYRVYCPPGTEPCAYASHVFDGPVPELTSGISVSCVEYTDRMYVGFATVESVPSLRMMFGWDGAVDPSLCSVTVQETDGREWRTTCSLDPPSPAAPCQIGSVSADDGFSLDIRCAGMTPFPVEAGFEADLGHADDPASAVAIQFSRCIPPSEVSGDG